MNHLKSLIFAICATFMLGACNVDDLRSDIDDLTKRMDSLEELFNSMYSDIYGIKELLDGEKTIENVKLEGGTYTLNLSNGETITLNQGGKGKIAYPELGVNANGEWTVNGKVLTTQDGKPVSSKGEAGKDGKTPMFQIEPVTNYWQVRYSKDEDWEYVTDDQGKQVAAVATGSGGVGDSFFNYIKVENGYLIFTLKGDAEPRPEYKIAIVSGLTCVIEEPKGGSYNNTNNTWSFGYGTTAETTVETSGEHVIVSAPNGWEAVIVEVEVEEGDVKKLVKKLKVTAPQRNVVAGKSRAVADNQTDVVVQANKGDHWAIAKIRVKAMAASYREVYESGESLMICGMEINNSLYNGEESVLIDASNVESIKITDGKVYFVDSDVTLSTANFTAKKMMIIGNNPNKKTKMELTAANGAITVTGTANDDIFVLHNLDIDLKTSNISRTGALLFEKLLLDNCVFKMPSRHFLVHSGAIVSGNAYFHNCIFNYSGCPANSKYNLINTYSTPPAKGYDKIDVYNNVFCYKGSNETDLFFMQIAALTAYPTAKIVVRNNSFINVTHNAGYIAGTAIKEPGEVTVVNNIFYASITTISYTFFANNTVTPIQTNSSNNFYYGVSWNWANSDWNNDDKELINKCTEDPFTGEGALLDFDNLKFKPNTAFRTAHPTVGVIQ